MKIIDTATTTTGKVRLIHAEGVGAVARYLSPNTANHPSKQLQGPEIGNIHMMKMGIVSCWEQGFPTHAGYFNQVQGDRDARDAIAIAKRLFQPSGSAIYATVDYDASFEELMGPILTYFTHFHNLLKAEGYLTGVYGSGMVIDKLYRLGYAHYRWLSQSGGFHGTHGYQGADIVQGPATTLAGLDVDTGVLLTQGGAW